MMADCPPKKRRGPKPYLTDFDRKQRRSEIDKKRNKMRIYIGAERERWEALKASKSLKFDHELAKLLLDSYEEKDRQENLDFTQPTISTPAAGRVKVELSSRYNEPEISIIESIMLKRWLVSAVDSPPSSATLPDPRVANFPHDKELIVSANHKIVTTTPPSGKKRKRGNYQIYDSEQRAKMAKYAVENYYVL